eukprot:gene7177-12843_t
MDNQHVALLAMLDLSAAFDTVNHGMLLNKMESRFGISGTVLNWFRSYLDGRRQRVIVNNAISEEMHLNCGATGIKPLPEKTQTRIDLRDLDFGKRNTFSKI